MRNLAVEDAHRNHRAAFADRLPEHRGLVLVQAGAEKPAPHPGFLQPLLHRGAAGRQPVPVEDADIVAVKASGLQGLDRGLRVFGSVEGRNDRFVCHGATILLFLPFRRPSRQRPA